MGTNANIFATLFGGASAYFFTQALYYGYVKKDKNFNFSNAMLLAFVNGVMAYISYHAFKDENTTGGYKGISEYGGIEVVPDPELIRDTCYCEPVCYIRCYAKGIIGALSKEQIKKYCPDKYEELVQEMSGEFTKVKTIAMEQKPEIKLNTKMLREAIKGLEKSRKETVSV